MEIDKVTHYPFKDELLCLLKRELPLHSVYVISIYKQKEKQKIYLSPSCANPQLFVTYTLLLVSYKPVSKRLGDLMNELYHKMQRRCEVYPITYSLSSVKKKMNAGNNFLARIMSQTDCVYKENETLSGFQNFKPSYHRVVYERIESDWNNRMARARYLLSIVDVDFKEDYSAKLATIHHALEQICLGLLYVFWEFSPHHYALSYLLHLCGHFTDLPQRIFLQTTYGLQRQFYLLCNAHHIMQFKAQNEFSEQDGFKAHHLSERFYEEAKRLGEEHLKHLKRRHLKKINSQLAFP
jgi:hypothetical protein